MKNISKILAASLLSLCASVTANAGDKVTVEVLQKSGEPLKNALVLLDVAESPDHSTEPYVMDQVNMTFSPHVLVVPKNAPVSFPNSDPVGHHVYSFSRPNHFVLPLYRGTSPDPIRFAHPGVVVLGCNIHDHMVGYIVVTENQTYGWTDETGRVELGPRNVGSEQKLHIWNPRLSTRKEQLSYVVENDFMEIKLKHKLKRTTQHTAKFNQY